MIEHSPTAWRHDVFSQSIIKVSNHDLYYRAMIFYLEEEPMLLNDLLNMIAAKIDLAKCVSVMKKTGYISSRPQVERNYIICFYYGRGLVISKVIFQVMMEIWKPKISRYEWKRPIGKENQSKNIRI
jgi:hypothetical protein